MKHKVFLMIVVISLLLLSAGSAGAVGPRLAAGQIQTPGGAQRPDAPDAPQAGIGNAFTYQGYLEDNGAPADGPYDFRFYLCDAAGGGCLVDGATYWTDVNDLVVVNGLFSAAVNFGAGRFNGQQRWLEVGVRPGISTDSYTILAPRSEIKPSPYAMTTDYALIAETATGKDGGTMTIGALSGTLYQIGGREPYGDPQFNGGFGLVSGANFLSPMVWMYGATGNVFQVKSKGYDTSVEAGALLLQVDVSGNTYVNNALGIGTTSPDAALDIAGGDILLDANAQIYGYDTSGIYGFLKLYNGDNGDVELGTTFWSGDIAFTTGDNEAMRIKHNGNVGVGVADPQEKLDIAGTTRTDILQIDGGADLAEPFEIVGAENVVPGLLVSIDPDHPGQLRIADMAYDHMVVGCVSGANGLNPGLVMQQIGSAASGAFPVALSGRVYCWADASYGAIQPGDLLTSSATPGHVMAAGDYGQAQGAIIGKAMSALEDGLGLILVLVSLQ